MIGTYDPKKVVCSFGGIVLTGIKDGTFIEVERHEDTFTPVVGSSGEESWTKSANRSGKITITLMSTSQDNDAMNAVLQQDELLGTGVRPFFLKELNGTTICHAPNARISKPPKIERAKEQGGTEWVIVTTNLEMQAGGIFA